MYIDASPPRAPGDRAKLVTWHQPPATEKCAQFWYHMYGLAVGTLNVYIERKTLTPELLWMRTGTQGNMWRKGHVPIVSSAAEWQLIFEAVRGASWSGDIALDDITVTDGPCPVENQCDFEVNMCWQQSITDDFNWDRGILQSGPSGDHTTGTAAGNYAYPNAAPNQNMGDNAMLFSQSFTISGPADCLQFWYHMADYRLGQLNVYLQQGPIIGTAVWSMSRTQGDVWRIARVTLNNPGQSVQVVMEVIYGDGIPGTIAIDDVTIRSGACPRQGYCTFEQDTCGWQNTATGDDLDWLWNSGGTPSLFSGPDVDHTTNSDLGHYMFVDASGGGGNRAWLVSEHFQSTASSCLSFWYHMTGLGSGTISVYKRSDGTLTKLWDRSGDQGNVWNQAQVDLSSITEFQLLIEAELGSFLFFVSTDIAVDDMDFQAGPCANQVVTTPSPTMLPATFPPGTADCNFDLATTCGWIQDTSDDFDWIVQNSTTDTYGTGPSGDHTSGSAEGYYAFVDSTGVANDAKARILSPSLPASSTGRCLRFWYHMFGYHVDFLKVYTSSGGSLQGPIWQKYGNQGNEWKYAQVHLTATGVYQVALEGSKGPGWQGDIAVDDVGISDGPCLPTK
ncbi:MAM and LDL-receptor class A domain-containing protein 1-like [Branchiostoma lanceolatum]|uniref:MAM and LDL-receptor class A domain-containing protein 1-like n=1 Tax=Branchiostoma lanceolatum TaxID=7740 RepID=UPI003454C66D